MEYAATIGEAPWSERIVTVGFQSIIAHTAASSTIDFGALSDEAALVMMLPMFIGADAASTAGGIKTATFLVAMLAPHQEIPNETQTTKRTSQSAD